MIWVITQDLIQTDKVGHSNTLMPVVPESLPFEFRLKDDDDKIYYYGRSGEGDTESAFGPLDWAEPYAGCTSIEYRQGDGTWEVL